METEKKVRALMIPQQRLISFEVAKDLIMEDYNTFRVDVFDPNGGERLVYDGPGANKENLTSILQDCFSTSAVGIFYDTAIGMAHFLFVPVEALVDGWIHLSLFDDDPA